MNHSPADSDDRTIEGRTRLRFELIFASVWLGVGLFLLPAVIFGVGILLLGPYGESAGLGRFYVDFFADLAEPSGRAWTIALGPLVLITLLRLVFLGTAPVPDEDDAVHHERVRPKSESARVEPRIGLD